MGTKKFNLLQFYKDWSAIISPVLSAILFGGLWLWTQGSNVGANNQKQIDLDSKQSSEIQRLNDQMKENKDTTQQILRDLSVKVESTNDKINCANANLAAVSAKIDMLINGKTANLYLDVPEFKKANDDLFARIINISNRGQ